MSDVEQFRRFADLLPEAMLLVAGDGTVLAANLAGEERLGIPVAAPQQDRLTQRVTEDAEAVLQYLRICARSRKMVLGSLTFQRDHGPALPCRCEGAVFRPRCDETPALILLRLVPKESASSQFLTLNQRVTELTREIARRKEVEAELHEKSESLHVTLTSIGDAVIVTDACGIVTFMNPVAEELTGWRQAEAVGACLERVFNIIGEKTRQPVESPATKVLREGKVVGLANHTVLIARDGTAKPIDDSAAPIRGSGGDLLGVVLVFRDISERRKMEETRNQTEQTLRFLADASSALAVLVDYESTLRKVAGLAVPFFADWSAVDVIEEDCSVRRLAVAHVDSAKVSLAQELDRRYPPDANAERGVPHVLRSGESELVEDIPEQLLIEGAQDEEHLRILRDLGLKSYMCVPIRTHGRTMGAVSFVMAESGRRYCAADLAVAEDLAHRAGVAIENARLYRQLQEADRRKNEFLATLAHELRNPLAPVRNGLEIMRLAANRPEALGQTRAMMERQLGHMVRLIDDLLDVSRITRGLIELRKERVDLAAIVQTALETSRSAIESAGHQLTVTLPRGVVHLDADPTRLAQVVSNILNNAARYTPSGGRIHLTAERQGQQAVVRVCDTGLGIPAELLPRVFDMFAQINRRLERSQGGLGIGLALVRNLVQLHDGKVEAHSAGLGKGSEFVVRLPIAAPERDGDEPAAEAPAMEGDRSAFRILVIDDNIDAADSLAMLLRMLRHEVWVAHDGPAGIELARRERPDLIFLDIGLPGLSGYEVARRMRHEQELDGVRIIALTGWGQPEDRRRSQEAGFDDHLVKPVDPATLADVFRVPDGRK